MQPPLERLRGGETLCSDGGWGTQLMARGLKPGECPEALNFSNPEALVEVATHYVEAGADIVGSNCGNGIDKMVEIAAEFSPPIRRCR